VTDPLHLTIRRPAEPTPGLEPGAPFIRSVDQLSPQDARGRAKPLQGIAATEVAAEDLERLRRGPRVDPRYVERLFHQSAA
jgi:hypothetical protein